MEAVVGRGVPSRGLLGLRRRSLLGVPPLVVLLVNVFHGFVLHSLAAVSLAFARPVVVRVIVCACGVLLGLCWGVQGLRVRCGCGLRCLNRVLVAAGVLLSCARLMLAVSGWVGLCWVSACASGGVSGWCLVGVGVVARQFWWWLNSGWCFWRWSVDGWQWLGVGLVHRWHRAFFGGHRLALYCPREALRVVPCWLWRVWLGVAGVRG